MIKISARAGVLILAFCLNGCLLYGGTTDAAVRVEGQLETAVDTACELSLVETPSGRALSHMDIKPGTFQRTFVFHSRVGGPFRVDLRCGASSSVPVGPVFATLPSYPTPIELGNISSPQVAPP